MKFLSEIGARSMDLYTSSYDADSDGTKDGSHEQAKATINTRVVRGSDREPTLGFGALLPSEQYSLVRQHTARWEVEAASYVDVAWISRADIMQAYRTAWRDGPDEVAPYMHDFYPDLPVGGGGQNSSTGPGAHSAAAFADAAAAAPELTQIHGRLAAVERDIRGVHEKLDRLLSLHA